VVGPSVAALLTFPGVARIPGGIGAIVQAKLMTNLSTCTARHRLHLYSAAPAIIADNAPFTLLYANRAIRFGYLDFPAMTTEAAGSDSAESLATWTRLVYQCAAASRDILGVLETLDAYTPISGQQYRLDTYVERG
jgi:hypothetical protein